MSMFNDIAEEDVRRKQRIETFNYYLNKGVSLDEMKKVLDYQTIYDGINANPYDFHWRTRLE